MRIAVPDLISPSYFPAIAAVDLGFTAEEGVPLELDLLFPVTDAAVALREGRIDFLAGAAHAPLHAFTEWQGVKLLGALSQHMYWFLIVRSDLRLERGGLAGLSGLRIGAAPGPDLGLQLLLDEAGIDTAAEDIRIEPVAGTSGGSVSFGVAAAEALAAGRIDGFWANGMGAEVAVREGVGTVVLDVRRGDGPPAAKSYTFPALMTTDGMITQNPEAVAGVVRAVVRTQEILRADPERATEVGRRLFPPMEAEMIAELVRRDTPFYEPAISDEVVQGVNRFAQRAGLLQAPVAFEDVVATSCVPLWAR